MQKKKPGFAAHEVMNDLKIHFRENERMLKHLLKACELVPEMSKAQIERSTTDVLAGTIATIVGRVCSDLAGGPVIMVTTKDTKKALVKELRSVVEALKKLDHLPPYIPFQVREVRRKYFCTKRFYEAVENGRDLPSKYISFLTLNGVNEQMSAKICVKDCSPHCPYRNSCKYIAFIESMMSGAVSIQVYDCQQYHAAEKCNQLPKTRLTVYAPETRKLLVSDKEKVLTEKRLHQVLNRLTMDCTKVKARRDRVHRLIADSLKHSDALFNMSAASANRNELLNHLKSIEANLISIRGELISELAAPKRRDIGRQLDNIISVISQIRLSNDITVENKASTNKALVAF